MLRLSLVLTLGMVIGVEGQTSANFQQAGPSVTENTGDQIDTTKFSSAIRSLFGERGARLRVDVLSVCSCPMATGEIQLSVSDIVAPPLDHPDRPVMWLGRSVSETGKSYPVWARASVVEARTMVIACRNLKFKQRLQAGDVSAAQVDVSPLWALETQNVASYEGKLLMEPRAKGQILTPLSIAKPPTIVRGDKVLVDITGSGTHLSVEAEAQTSGNVGDSIFLVNPMSRRKFRAIVSGPGTARVLIGPI